ncbi:MAG: XRE family transcriptional regulator [Desulfuromonadales bacterium]|nr:MAG: XRE family transcriptional regulator [Desulfuromonadales bacterium]
MHSDHASDTSLGRRIKGIRQGRGLTQKEFADSLGIVQGFLSGIERGKKTPSDTLLIALCTLYGIRMEWLTSGVGEMLQASRQSGPSAASPVGGGIPVLARIPQEFPDNVGTEDILYHVTLPNLPAECFALVAYGDFMAPTIRDGDLVFFRPGEAEENGAIVLVTNRWGEPILRRYRVRDGEVFCSPDNATYATFKPAPETRVIGTVVDVWRKVRI